MQQSPYNLESTEIMKVLGKEWAQMDCADKRRYEDISLRDKRRFETEMKAFRAIGGSKEMLQKIKAATPKKCLSAYMIFVRETRKRIQTENPDMPAL